MRPISLTLKGFRGIRDGLGRDALTLDFEKLTGGAQLVAIAGRNGRGKTTIMDNMTPYPIMPSRTGADGLGSFSYYDHVYLPENLKELVWEHGGRRYRTQMVIRLNGKKRTEAFLHMQGPGGWSAARLPGGTVSDGKADTYMRCVEGILGSAETFFTSVFSAQGRRQLSAYRNAEIKTLLADLLGLEEIRALGAKASETVRLLKAGLNTVRHDRAGLQAEADQIAGEIARLGNTRQRIGAAQTRKESCQSALDAAKEALAKALATKDTAMQTEARRRQLQEERRSIINAGKAALASLDRQDQREAERLVALNRRIAQRASELAAKRTVLMNQRDRLDDILRQGGHIERAVRRLPLAEKLVLAHASEVQACHGEVEQWRRLMADEKLLQTKVAAIEREAGQAALKAQELARRFGLTEEVPCAGTDLQGQCKLLGDAYAAKSLIPSASIRIARLEEERGILVTQLAETRRQAAGLASARAKLNTAEDKLRRAKARASALALSAARRGELLQARETLAGVERQIQELTAADSGDTGEEQAERAATCHAREQIAAQREAESQRHRESLNRVDAALTTLPAPFDETRVTLAQQAVARMQREFANAESAFMAAVHDQQRAEEARRRQVDIAHRIDRVDARCAGIEEALGRWMLFAKCMSNDGLIALSIDDAGPALSGLTNDLLLACYGPRFTVSIKTLIDTAKGEAREGFDIIVHDAESGAAKSVATMSGGERVWINECLTRAIALYLAQNAGKNYETLFSDEADGPLDAERKRMFMAMKREVLRIGRYGREYFVSQTPELTATADAVIDLEVFGAALPVRGLPAQYPARFPRRSGCQLRR